MKAPRPNRPLGSVNVLPAIDGLRELEVCPMLDPERLLVEEKFTRAVLALDGSRSMINDYGDELWGVRNKVQLVSRKIGSILARKWSKEGKVDLLYWSAGPGGKEVEFVGELSDKDWSDVQISGPSRWGPGTKLLPVVKHIVQQSESRGADNTLGVVITDGVFEDDEECFDYLKDLGKKLVAKKRPTSLKFVFVGIGKDVDRIQLDRYDNMFEDDPKLKGKVDLCSAGVASDWSEEHHILGAIFAELQPEDQIVGTGPGRILDSDGKEVAAFADGLPGRFRFNLRQGHTSFRLCFAGEETSQDIADALDLLRVARNLDGA